MIYFAYIAVETEAKYKLDFEPTKTTIARPWGRAMGHLLGGFVKLDLVITAPHYTPHESFETSFVTATKSNIQMAYENFMSI